MQCNINKLIATIKGQKHPADLITWSHGVMWLKWLSSYWLYFSVTAQYPVCSKLPQKCGSDACSFFHLLLVSIMYKPNRYSCEYWYTVYRHRGIHTPITAPQWLSNVVCFAQKYKKVRGYNWVALTTGWEKKSSLNQHTQFGPGERRQTQESEVQKSDASSYASVISTNPICHT